MNYDAAGNLIADTYSGAGARTYDAENRMTTAADYTGQTSRYTYDADGRRVRVQVASSQETWHVYGFDNELLAEYPAMASASAPEKEYGYRNGQLLVTATGRSNVALAANGAVASASSSHTCCGFSLMGAINGNNRGPWGNGEGWNDATESQVPDWIQVDFAGSKTIDEISVFSLHDNYSQENTPTETQTFSLYGLLAFDVQYWNGSSWTTIPGGSVTGNNKVWRKFTFSPITTNKIRVWINTVPDAWSRVVEIQAFGTSAGGEKVQWLVSDHLGTPRIILDQTGDRLNVKRHDYLPFGEELYAGTGGRTPLQGYSVSDGIRQKFTGKERDVETELDYFLARYYANTQGRFTSIDPASGSIKLENPQSLNRYSYTLNNPLRFVDPDGRIPLETALDVVSIAHSFYELIKSPSWVGAGFLVWDVAATFIPYVPGSYVAKGIRLSREAVEWSAKIGSEGYRGLKAAGIVTKLDEFETVVNNQFIKDGVGLLGQGDDSVRKVLGMSSDTKTADFLGVTQNGTFKLAETKGTDLGAAVEQLDNTAKALTGKLGDVDYTAEIVLRKGTPVGPGFEVRGNQLHRFNVKTNQWELAKANGKVITVRYHQ
jgi:RHS repeat-associated protein